MIVGFTRNIAYMYYIQLLLKQNLNGDWLEVTILQNLETLHEYDFMLRPSLWYGLDITLLQVAVIKGENNFC